MQTGGQKRGMGSGARNPATRGTGKKIQTVAFSATATTDEPTTTRRKEDRKKARIG